MHYFLQPSVRMLDLGYPSNFDTFGELVSTPGIIFKNPNTIHKMFHHEDIHNDIPHFKVTNLEQWGAVMHYDQIGLVYYKFIFSKLEKSYFIKFKKYILKILK